MININKINIITIITILVLFVSAVSGSIISRDIEIRGSIANGDMVYDYTNFGAFWYDLNLNQSSETINVTVDVIDRTIKEGNLVYSCISRNIKYKNKDLNDIYGTYSIMGFMAEKYICYDNKVDKLVKLLIEWDSGESVVLAIDDPMEFSEGYMLTAQEIDLQGNRVWLKLYKDGKCIDDSIVNGGDTYIYEDENDVLLFSAQIKSVFRGTESNFVEVKYVFMRSNKILDINGGDIFGVMEVKSTSGSIVLKNDEIITLDADSKVDIMDGLYFKIADDPINLRYYLAKTVSLKCLNYPECPELVPCPPCNKTPCPIMTPEIVIEYVNVSVPMEAESTSPKYSPEFGAIFVLIGLLGVAYIIAKQRE